MVFKEDEECGGRTVFLVKWMLPMLCLFDFEQCVTSSWWMIHLAMHQVFVYIYFTITTVSTAFTCLHRDCISHEKSMYTFERCILPPSLPVSLLTSNQPSLSLSLLLSMPFSQYPCTHHHPRPQHLSGTCQTRTYLHMNWHHKRQQNSLSARKNFRQTE